MCVSDAVIGIDRRGRGVVRRLEVWVYIDLDLGGTRVSHRDRKAQTQVGHL